MRIVTCEQMKAIELKTESFGISMDRLMENAGSAAAGWIRNHEPIFGSRCVILSGKGNNGGDGFVVARKLAQNGAVVTVILADGEPRSELAAEMLSALRSTGIPLIDYTLDKENRSIGTIEGADLLIDAVYGTGFRGEIPGRLHPLFDAVNRAHAKTIALDVPSGANADSGDADPHSIEADCTLAFEAIKPGHLTYPCKQLSGTVFALPIGIPEEVTESIRQTHFLMDNDLIRPIFKKRPVVSHKGTFGRLVNIAGSVGMGGAAILSTRAALRSGAGLVTLMAPASLLGAPIPSILEALTAPLQEDGAGGLAASALEAILERVSHADAVMIGCGLGTGEGADAIVRGVLEAARCPVVIDADGINLLARHIDRVDGAGGRKLIVTPHPGEMARLTGKTTEQIMGNRTGYASAFARRTGIITLLKGAGTVVALPDGRVYICPTGNPGMARGGSGDVLTGMIGAFLAQGIDPASATIAGAYLHGMAGDLVARELSQTAMLPTDLIERGIPQVFLSMGR